MNVVSMSRRFVLLLLAEGLSGCGLSSVPSAPSPAPQAASTPIPISLVLFTDPVSRVSTADVRDAQEQIVRFNTAGELVWTVDDTRFPGYPVDLRGPFVGWNKYYQVRFATRDGERRAYLCGHGHNDVTDPPPLCDVEVVGGRLFITELNVLCPGI